MAEQRPETPASELRSVGIIGLGYVGLPLLMAFRDAGCTVVGVDVDPEKIQMLESGESYLSHIPSQRLKSCIAEGTVVTTDFSAISEVGAIVIAVPTPLTDVMTPDLSFIEDTAESLGPNLVNGQLVSLESTTYPGTTREVLIPRLEATSGLSCGKDIFVAFSPERVDPGDAAHEITEIPKLVSGFDEESLRRACELYSIITPQVVPVSSLEVAEMSKLLENIYRSVNIALVNEMKMLADRMDLDIWEVVEAASTKPFGFQAFYPGPGLGGHCLPIDPFYLYWRGKTKYDFETRFIELAGKINSAMPAYVVERTRESLLRKGRELKGASVLLLGLSYKKDISDTRESPGLKLMSLFEDEEGADVSYHDPFVPSVPPTREYPHFKGRESVALDAGLISSRDVVVIATDHSDVDYHLVGDNAALVVDTRNAMKVVSDPSAEIVRA